MKNSIRFITGMLCESSAVDQGTQNLSVFKVLEQIKLDVVTTDPTRTAESEKKINIPFNFEIISLWKRQNVTDLGKDIDTNIEIELVDPNGDVLQTVAIDVHLPATKIRSRFILKVQGIGVTTSGEYSVRFKEMDGKGNRSETLATLPFDVIVNKS
jgi:hypothetical protein